MDKTIEALEKLVQIKNETIKELEKQIQLLKNSSILQPITTPSVPYQTWPWQPTTIGTTLVPYTNPLSPYTITCTPTSTDVTLTSDQTISPGSVQMNKPNFIVTNNQAINGQLDLSRVTNGTNVTHLYTGS